jgi:hypothetical protein
MCPPCTAVLQCVAVLVQTAAATRQNTALALCCAVTLFVPAGMGSSGQWAFAREMAGASSHLVPDTF